MSQNKFVKISNRVLKRFRTTIPKQLIVFNALGYCVDLLGHRPLNCFHSCH